MEKTEKIINNIKQASAQLKGEDVYGKEMLVKLDNLIEQYLEAPTPELSKKIELLPMKIGTSLDKANTEDHILNHTVNINGEPTDLSSLIGKLAEANIEENN